jgi:ABC-type sugar transport system ATPase subunit
MTEERDPAAVASGSRSASRDGRVEPVLLEVVDLSKSYGPVRAVRGLSLDVRVGEVHAICGHNGAGKSTLVKTLVGLVRPDDGVIRFEGQELSLRNPQEAQAHGIALVNQELSLVPELSVEDNVFLGGIDVPLLYRRRRLSEQARSVLDQLGLAHVQLTTPVEKLSIGERQLVEIARLLVRNARLLILDEPTATLSKPEIARVFKATRDLVAQGRSVIFVSHRLDEVFELCDRVTVLRDGMRVGTHEINAIDRRSLIEHMLGEMEGAKTHAEHEHPLPGSGAEVVRIDRLNVPGSVEELSLSLESGVITGLAGQVGSGTSTVLRALGGLVPNASGTITVGGRDVLVNTPRRAADAGVLYIPNDRQREGLFLGQSVERNLTVQRLRRLSRMGVLLRRRAQRVARELAAAAGIPTDRLGSPVASLSGGNQQKVLLGRALRLDGVALLALDEPTRGVDVGGRAEIHNVIREAARKGTAVVFSSTELDEVLDLADVVVTLFHGRIVSVVPRAKASGSAILADMTTTEREPRAVPS